MTDSESNRETKKPRPAWLDWLQIFAVAAVLAFVLNTFLIANARVPTGSMITTIMPGDRVIGSRLSYRFEDPARGDIIIFHAPDEPETLYVKRIIGLSGRQGHDSGRPCLLKRFRDAARGVLHQRAHEARGVTGISGARRRLLLHGRQPERFGGRALLEKPLCLPEQDCRKSPVPLLARHQGTQVNRAKKQRKRHSPRGLCLFLCCSCFDALRLHLPPCALELQGFSLPTFSLKQYVRRKMS